MFKTIVVGVDGSETADRAVVVACGLAKVFGSDLNFVSAPQDETAMLVMSGVGGYVPLADLPTTEMRKEAGQQVLEKAKLLSKEQGVEKVKTHIELAPAAMGVLNVAKAVNADLIVTGRRGLGGIASLFVGSTSQSIAHDATCACLTVP